MIKGGRGFTLYCGTFIKMSKWVMFLKIIIQRNLPIADISNSGYPLNSGKNV